MDEKQAFDFWYAVNNTEILKLPARHIETFGATVLNYHLVSELMDTANRTRVREGRMQARQPQIIAPSEFSQTVLEGFGDEARKYVDHLREHEDSVRILQYGYRLKQEEFSEHVISGNPRAIAEQVSKEARVSDDPLSAIVIGVDEPWDVCLIRLFHEVAARSVLVNIREMERRHMFDDSGGLPQAVRHEIEADFRAAGGHPGLTRKLGAKLQRMGVFQEYEDRFFALLRGAGNK